MTTAAAVQFSDEYKFDVSTDAYLNFVQQYGKIITKDESIWTQICLYFVLMKCLHMAVAFSFVANLLSMVFVLVHIGSGAAPHQPKTDRDCNRLAKISPKMHSEYFTKI